MPYFVWKSELRRLGGTTVMLYKHGKWNSSGSRLSCHSVSDRLPPVLEYELEPDNAELLDMSSASSRLDLCSRRVAKLLSEFGVQLEAIPGRIRTEGGKIISEDHSYLHVLGRISAVDWEKSKVEVGIDTEGEKYVARRGLIVLREDFTTDLPDVFRLKEADYLILVSRAFADEWQSRGLTGATFTDLVDY